MELNLCFLVTTLLTVQVYAQLQKESSTVSGFNVTTTVHDGAFVKNSTISTVKDDIVEQVSTTQTAFNVVSSRSSQTSTDPAVVQDTTEPTTTEREVAGTTPVYETASNFTASEDEKINPISTTGNAPSSPTSTENTINQNVDQTTAVYSDKQLDVTSTQSTVEEMTVPTNEKLLSENSTKGSDTEVGERPNQSQENEKTADWKNREHRPGNSITPNRMPPREFMEWLDSIHPESNTTKVKNVIDTSIISTEKLIFVISTICGTFVLFVLILIAISCCKRNKNIRNDSEKSDFSMTSVVSIPEKRKSDVFSTDKNGLNNVFMGIPANNEVWKNLEQLSPAAPSVMPESTKM